MLSEESEEVWPEPFRVREELGEKMFCMPALGPGVPIKALIPELAENVRAVFTAASSADGGRFHDLDHDQSH